MSKLSDAVRADVERHAKRKRAIKGEIKPGLEFQALCAIAHNCNKILWREKYLTFGYEQRKDLEYFERTIIEDVQNWIGNANEESLRRILDLDKKTRRWLSKRIESWEEYQRQAKLISPVPVPFQRAIKEIYLDNVKALLNFCEDIYEWPLDLGNEEEIEQLFWDGGEQWQDSRFKRIRNKAVAEIRQVLPCLSEYLDNLEIKNKRGWPPKWIAKDKAIMKALERKGNRHFLKLYQLLKENKIEHRGTPELMQQRKWVGGEGGALPVLVKPGYTQIEKGTALKEIQTRRYLQEMARHGIIKKMGKDGERGQYVYSLGYWVQGNSIFPKPIFYLQQTKKMKESLRNFDANHALKR